MRAWRVTSPSTSSGDLPVNLSARSVRVLVWLVLALPLIVQTWRYWGGTVFYGEYIHWSGKIATQLLLVTLIATPLQRLFPAAGWIRALVRYRRDLGTIAFCYALAHTVVYVLRQAEWGAIISEALEPGLATGWVALALMAALAITSNDVSVRKLGRNWKRLHRAAYVVAALTMLHWILTAFDPNTAYVYLGLLLVILAPRLWPSRSERTATRT